MAIAPEKKSNTLLLEEFLALPETKPAQEYNKIQISPDWIIDKISFALKHGTKLGWLIAPKERHILTFQNNNLQSHQGVDALPTLEIFNDWNLSVQKVFDLLKFS